MRDHDHKLIRLQWVVIGVLVVGSVAGGIMLVHKADDLSNANAVYSGDVDSLRNQLREAKNPTPVPTPEPTPAATSAPTPSPAAATPSPSPVASPN